MAFVAHPALDTLAFVTTALKRNAASIILAGRAFTWVNLGLATISPEPNGAPAAQTTVV